MPQGVASLRFNRLNRLVCNVSWVSAQLIGIRRYPVKSCQGHDLQSALVQPWGLDGDRRWMVVDADGAAVTAREVPALLLVAPLIVDGGLTFTAPGRAALVVEAPTAPLVEVSVWGNRVVAALAGPCATQWFSDVVGSAVRLVHLDDPTRRAPNPAYAQAHDRVCLADGYPLLVVNHASLAALDALTPAEAPPLSVVRFRPNLVVSGLPAWAEDGWRRVRIGEARFRAVKGCDRCVITTIDPDTLVRGHEPIATLARHRRWDGKTWFGVNLVPDTPDATIQVGDEVQILDEVLHPDGPLR